MKLHYAGMPGDGYGWGVCNAALLRELGMAREITECHPGSQASKINPDVVFMPLADHDFNPATNARGKVNLGYSFFEYPLGPNAAENAKKYDVVFVGSTWCKERCAERGILNTEVLIQGVDSDIFFPGCAPRYNSDGQFRIFSGGKFEYRKGQDLVIAAFREFAKTHPEAHLVCSWFNPWPQLIRGMSASQVIRWPIIAHEARNQEELYSWFLCENGLRPDQFTILPKLSQRDLALEMANTDCGLFPNRCEGGTNLVLMEYAACGRQVIANKATGHRDIAGLIDIEIECMSKPKLPPEENGWCCQKYGWMQENLEDAYFDRTSLAGKVFPTWKSAAEKIIATAERCLYQSQRVEPHVSLG